MVIIIMNIFLLERYINKITKNDIHDYLKKEGIDISNQELNILYTHLKKDYKVFIIPTLFFYL